MQATWTRWILGAFALLVTVGLAGTDMAYAGASIIFDQGNTNQGGTISYDGEGGVLMGRGIIFDEISASGVPFPQTFNCLGCTLDFDTGTNISEGPNTWTFRSGGSFTLTGTIPGVTGIGVPIVFNGVFTGTPTVTLGNLGKLNFQSFGTDEKNADLLTELGVSPTALFGFSNTTISAVNAVIGANGSFSGVLLGPNGEFGNADMTNDQLPVPGTLVLLFGGLTALVVGRRRQNG